MNRDDDATRTSYRAFVSVSEFRAHRPVFVDDLAAKFVEEVRIHVLRHGAATLPESVEPPDWRPGEVLPEDHYSLDEP